MPATFGYGATDATPPSFGYGTGVIVVPPDVAVGLADAVVTARFPATASVTIYSDSEAEVVVA